MDGIENSPLWREARSITNSGETKTNFGWRVLIHYGDNLTMKPLKTLAVNNHRDYAGGLSDETTVTVMMGLGAYSRQIYPNREKLQITLYKLPQGELSEAGNEDTPVESERFSALLIDEGASPTVAQGAETNDEQALDLTDIVNVHFQLLNKSLEQIRLMTVGGVFRNTTMEDLLKAMLTKEAMKADVDQVRALVGVDVVDISNKDVQQQVVITHGTKLTDVPQFLQKRIGLYNAGMGSYIQNKFWHIFSLFDTTKFALRQQTLTVMVLPKKKYSDIERTYRLVGDSLTVLCTGETGFKDDSGTDYVNQGNGARFNNAEKMMEGVSTNAGNKAVISRARNANEVMTEARPDGINHVPMAQNRITSNPFTIYSDLAARKGGYFKAVWQNSDPKLLLPGMMAKILYDDKGEIKELYGILHQVESISHQVGDVASERFLTQSTLLLFVNKNTSPDALSTS